MIIQLNSINDVKDFVAKANKSSKEIDVRTGRYVVDAKSILGMFSLDLSKTIELSMPEGTDDEFIEAINAYIVK